MRKKIGGMGETTLMMGFVFILLSLAGAIIHLLASRKPKTRQSVVDTFLLYSLVFNVGGVGLIFGFIPHVFFADYAAEAIGWATGSHFQYEVGLHDGAWGLLGILSIWIRGNFWLATGLGWSFFMLGAAYGHLHDTIVNANYAPNNFLMIFVDTLIPVILLTLLTLKYRLASAARAQ
jgi:hypothetical protein